jgi:UDP-N-acetylmuramate: L-alanyl-gamma-D-glutamyl-meso-diaminopimelate ligase
MDQLVNTAWNQEQISLHKNKIKKVFFYRISGMGMGTCATLFKEAGYDVAGCDLAFYPPMGDYLKKVGITCFTMNEVSDSLLKNYDLIVVGNSVSKDTPDARLIESCGIPYSSFPCVLGELILKERVVVGIAGTHGKTTTTYYLAQMLAHMGEDPGYLVGGVLTDREAAALGKSKYFVIESDEYDSSYFHKFSKFRLYNIKELILTALEYDHADIFKDMRDIEIQFEFILKNLKGFVYNSDYTSAQFLAKQFAALSSTAPIRYGLKDPAGPLDIHTQEGKTTFKLEVAGKLEEFETNIIGAQNILNMSGCILFCLKEGFHLAQVKKAVKNLLNVKRRQELRGTYKKAIVVEDFAHHPTAIELTLDAIKKTYKNLPIHVVFEAVTSTARSDAFQQAFVDSFAGTASVIVANPQLPTNASQFGNLNYGLLAQDLSERGIYAKEVKDLASLRMEIDKLAEKEGIVLILGNRTILGLWESDFVTCIQKK